MSDLRPIACDVLILGGGVAGLWTATVLSRRGLGVVLVERTALGTGQSIASQGIIHGGIKYTLTGDATRAARAISEMPGIWRACLDGRGPVDLTAVRVLSDQQHLWTTSGTLSRLMGVAASRVIRTQVRALDPAQRPAGFAGAPRGVDVYAVAEPVLDPAGVLGALAADASCHGARLVLGEAHHDHGAWRVRSAQHEMVIRPALTVLAAGTGNEGLLASLGLGSITMQRRPLHMVMVRGQGLPVLFGHCVAGALSDKPRVTITSEHDASGRVVWYVGGLIAEGVGVERSREDQIAHARRDLAACVPWADLTSTQWATLRVDRGEGLMPDGSRPDEPVVRREGGTIALWPTKLAFAPRVAEMIGAMVSTRAIGAAELGAIPADWPVPGVAPRPWEDGGVAWS